VDGEGRKEDGQPRQFLPDQTGFMRTGSKAELCFGSNSGKEETTLANMKNSIFQLCQGQN
jgi:hypothetical protein